jgi:hypothetical protein
MNNLPPYLFSMKLINLTVLLFLGVLAKAQMPQLHIPSATIGIVKNNQLCSDGNTLYYIGYSSTDYTTNIASLYKITGSSTTPVFVKELFKSDTAVIQDVAEDTKYEYKISNMQCVNGIFYLLYFVKPSAFSFSLTGWRLLTSDGTAAGTQVSILSNDVTDMFFPTYVFKASDGVYVFNWKNLNGPPFTYNGRWYKSMGTPATSGLVFNNPTNESSDGYTRFNITVKGSFVYFSTTKYTGTTATHTRYYRTNGTTTTLIKEVPFYLGAQFCVGDNDMLITYRTTMFNTTLGMNLPAPGYQIISLADFSELATFAPPNSASPQANNTWENLYDNYVGSINGVYYIQGYQNFNRGLYLLKADNSINFWQMPLNAGASNTAPFGDIEVKRTDNRIYFTQFYSAHKYSGTTSGTTGYNPVNARTSSLYYLTGGNPVLVDSLNALEGRFFNDMDYCGDVLYAETRFNSIYTSGGSPMQQRKVWRTDGTTVGSGFFNNLYNCTPLFGFYLGDIYPNGFIKHDGQLLFLGRTGCTFADQGNALYKVAQCGDALAMFKTAAATTTVSNANYTEGSRVFPYATSKPDSVLVAVYPNGLPLGNINATVYNEPNNVTAGGYTFLRRHYVINPTTDPVGTKKVRLYFTAADFAALQAADPSITGIGQLQVVKYDGPTEDGTFNESDATAVTIIPPSAIATGTEYGVNYMEFDITGFSEFWIAKASGTLPLTLLQFAARLQADQSVLLQWKTENETNVLEYGLELSTDGQRYGPVAQLAAHNTAGTHTYSHADRTPWTNNVRYYRLKQTDIDGKYRYSQVVRLALDKQNNISVYPNPAMDYVQVQSNTLVEQLQLMDMSGRVVKVFKGAANGRYPLQGIGKGVYQLKVFTKEGASITKLLIR